MTILAYCVLNPDSKELNFEDLQTKENEMNKQTQKLIRKLGITFPTGTTPAGKKAGGGGVSRRKDGGSHTSH